MFKRIYNTLMINMIPSAHKRTKWLKKHNVFRQLGENVSLQMRKIPLYPECIVFHNNIVVASNVSFLTHDAMHLVFNCYLGDNRVDEKIGCIEIMDNCFIGANSTILQNVKIGPNAIVAAGSFVNRDIPPGEVWGGVPARKIGLFDDILERRLQKDKRELHPIRQSIPEELVNRLWSDFVETHKR